MKKEMFLVMLLLVLVIPVLDDADSHKIKGAIFQGDIINITPLQVWDMLNSDEDGRQLVIDDRTFQEYFTERIATPHSYDKPILYPLQIMQKPFFLQLFINLFDGNDIIIYCRSANRSYIAATLLVDNGFQSTIYNMIGGINEWKTEGLPTVTGFGFGNYN